MPSINNAEKIRQHLTAGKVAIGTAITFADSAVSELSAEAGYDFTWIDTEHAPFDLNNALQHIVACRGTDAAPFVRVLQNEPNIIKPVLDLAPAGIIVPRVNTDAEARAAVEACRYPPVGIRGFGPRRGARFGATSQPDYLAEVAQDPILAIQIEHAEAVANIDEILAVAGIDIICLGPNDLSGSMGKLGQIDDPEVVAAIDLVSEKVRATDHILGTSTFYSEETFARWMERGVRWINLNVDFANLFRASSEVLAAARSGV
jgi:2-keto-3-deoxy-L-rhamnonate aldolase RhmA